MKIHPGLEDEAHVRVIRMHAKEPDRGLGAMIALWKATPEGWRPLDVGMRRARTSGAGQAMSVTFVMRRNDDTQPLDLVEIGALFSDIERAANE